MGKFDDVLAELREQREWLAGEISEFKSGRLKHSEKRDGQWVDITPDLIEDYTSRVSNLDLLIDAYGKRND